MNNAVIEEDIAEETAEDSAKDPQIINEIEKRILEKDKNCPTIESSWKEKTKILRKKD